jgi:hypothetical protein
MGIHGVTHARLANQHHRHAESLGDVGVGDAADAAHGGVAHPIDQSKGLATGYILHGCRRLARHRQGKEIGDELGIIVTGGRVASSGRGDYTQYRWNEGDRRSNRHKSPGPAVPRLTAFLRQERPV